MVAVPLVSALLVSACTKIGLSIASEPPVRTEFQRALALVEEGSFTEADEVLREVASTCESGADGKRALMLLASLSLDPRNRHANADSAALLAARYLFLPDPDPAERLLAESLYLLALDLGADPELRPTLLSGPGMLAPRFSDCPNGDVLVDAVPALPTFERETRADAYRSLLLKRDSLEARMARSEDDARSVQAQLQTELQNTQAELQLLQAELQRIRRLLGAPDTTRARPNGL